MRRNTRVGSGAIRGVVERAGEEVKWEEILQAAGEERIYLGIDEDSFCCVSSRLFDIEPMALDEQKSEL